MEDRIKKIAKSLVSEERFTFDYSGMKQEKDFLEKGYKFLAQSGNADGWVVSYIAINKKKKKVYGSYNWQTAKYVEEPAR